MVHNEIKAWHVEAEGVRLLNLGGFEIRSSADAQLPHGRISVALELVRVLAADFHQFSTNRLLILTYKELRVISIGERESNAYNFSG